MMYGELASLQVKSYYSEIEDFTLDKNDDTFVINSDHCLDAGIIPNDAVTS